MQKFKEKLKNTPTNAQLVCSSVNSQLNKDENPSVESNESKMFNIHELILLKQWYHAIEDINIHYLKDYDKTLYNKIKELLQEE